MIPDLNTNLLSIILPAEQPLYSYHAKRLPFLKENVTPLFNLLVQKGNVSVRWWYPCNMQLKYTGEQQRQLRQQKAMVVNATPRPLDPKKDTWFLLYTWLGGP